MSNIMEIEVSEGCLKNATKLLNNDKVQDMGDDIFQVAGSKDGEIYQVEFNKIHGLVCTKTNSNKPSEQGNLCMGWKNSHSPKICKHSYAVVLFKKLQESK